MKGMTLLLVVGIVGYLVYLRSEEKPTAPSGATGTTSGTGGHKSLGDFIDEFANLLSGASKAVAGSSGSDATNTPATSDISI